VVGNRGGTVVAVFQMAGDLGAVLGPVVAGAIADNHGYPPAFFISALVALTPLPFVAVARETLIRRERATSAAPGHGSTGGG
jgi:MFS family permease